MKWRRLDLHVAAGAEVKDISPSGSSSTSSLMKVATLSLEMHGQRQRLMPKNLSRHLDASCPA
jgi:hypothetical protein